MGAGPHTSANTNSNGCIVVIGQEEKGNWYSLPSLQKSKNAKSEFEQETRILFKTHFTTWEARCPNLACHCCTTLFEVVWATSTLLDNRSGTN